MLRSCSIIGSALTFCFFTEHLQHSSHSGLQLHSYTTESSSGLQLHSVNATESSSRNSTQQLWVAPTIFARNIHLSGKEIQIVVAEKFFSENK